MNLTKLFETQKVLDERIMEQHPELKGQNNLDWKILALQVELGECANEWRGFKKWSNNRDPRTLVQRICHSCRGKGNFTVDIHTNKKESCLYCGGTGLEENRNPLLEEYVDCLHFILSIGLEIGTEYFDYNQTHIFKEKDITTQFLRVIDYTIGLREDDYCSELLQSFIHLGEMLGFTWEQVEQAYYEKNEINHARQESGY